MTHYAYLFEAHTIQPFIFESGRMADMVGASELIEDLLETPLTTTLDKLNIKVVDSDFIRKGGAAFTLKMPDQESAIQLRDSWGLIVAEIAPSLLFTHTVSQGNTQADTLSNGRKQLQTLRNYSVPRLPVIGPLIIRAPRTGNPAVKLAKVKQDHKEWIDLASKAKRKDKFRKGHRLFKKFVQADETLNTFTFPLNLEVDEEDAFPFESNNRYVAIIHADGNGLGETLIQLSEALKNTPDDNSRLFSQVSESLKSATEMAASYALRQVFGEHDTGTQTFPKNKAGKIILPFRPLILGGDDLTVIIRGEFALEFVRHFIEQFEQESKRQLKDINSKHLPDCFTACAGIAFVKVNQPFYLAYQLAESLCDFAKKAAKKDRQNNLIPSTVALHRITSSYISDYDTAMDEEMTQVNASGQRRLTLGAYGLGQYADAFPPLSQLLKLKQLFQTPEMSKGPLRHFLTLLYAESHDAEKIYRRWLSNLESRWPTQHQDYLSLTKTLRHKSVEADTPSLSPFQPSSEAGILEQTFLGDLMHLIAVEGEAHDR